MCRWLLDPHLDLSQIAGITQGKLAPPQLTLSKPLESIFPVLRGHGTPPPITRTLNPKVIHHQAMSKLKIALNHVHTEEELQFLESGIDAIM